MQDPDDPPVEEGEIGGGMVVVRPTAADTAAAVIANSMAASTLPPWITVTARPSAETDPGQDASVPASHLPTRKQSPSRCRNGKMLIRAYHLRSEQRQREAARLDSQAEIQAKKGDLDNRIPLARTGRSEAEGARGGLRHGAATLRVFAESSAIAASPRCSGRGER